MPTLSFRPLLARLEERLLCSLVRVVNTRRFPFSAVAHVDVVYDTNRNGRVDSRDARASASAVMVGPDTALTSAHVVYDPELGGFAMRVTITPGRNGRVRPFGSFEASSWVVPSLFVNPFAFDADTASDFAVLNFKPIETRDGPRHIGALTGWMTPRAFPDQTLSGLRVVNVGYPAGRFTGTIQYRATGPILQARERGGVGFFSYSNSAIPIEEGSSGSPLFRTIAGTGTVVVGLTEATLVGANLNLATKITGRVASFIRTAQKVTEEGGRVVTFRSALRPALRAAAVDAVFAAAYSEGGG